MRVSMAEGIRRLVRSRCSGAGIAPFSRVSPTVESAQWPWGRLGAAISTHLVGGRIMADTSNRRKRQSPKPGGVKDPHGRETGNQQPEDPPIEEEPAVERGERIDTGKRIARGGKETGHIPGATSSLATIASNGLENGVAMQPSRPERTPGEERSSPMREPDEPLPGPGVPPLPEPEPGLPPGEPRPPKPGDPVPRRDG